MSSVSLILWVGYFVVQSLSRVWLFATPWTVARQAPLSFTISWSLLKFMSTESVMPSHHLILSRPLLFLPSIFISIRIFFNEAVLHIRWPKYWSFSFSISPSIEYSGFIFFRIDWFDLLAIQGTLNSLLQHHSSKVLQVMDVQLNSKNKSSEWKRAEDLKIRFPKEDVEMANRHV